MVMKVHFCVDAKLRWLLGCLFELRDVGVEVMRAALRDVRAGQPALLLVALDSFRRAPQNLGCLSSINDVHADRHAQRFDLRACQVQFAKQRACPRRGVGWHRGGMVAVRLHLLCSRGGMRGEEGVHKGFAFGAELDDMVL